MTVNTTMVTSSIATMRPGTFMGASPEGGYARVRTALRGPAAFRAAAIAPISPTDKAPFAGTPVWSPPV